MILTEQQYNSYQESMKVIREFNATTDKKRKEMVQALRNAYDNIEKIFKINEKETLCK